MKRCYGVLLQCLIMAAVSQSSAQILLFEHSIDNAIDGPAGIYSCDIDGDGDSDVIAGSNTLGVVVYRSSGAYPLQWHREVVESSFLGCFSVFATDIDGDGDTDIIGASWGRDEVAWWRNDGGDPIAWTRAVLDTNFVTAHEVYACDLDNDGDNDIMAAAASDEVAWWRNEGGDPVSWTKQTIDHNFSGARSVCAADFDGDGDNDIAGAALVSNEVTWWRNEGGEPITWMEFPIANNFNGSHRVEARDMDGDGDPDILGAAYADAEIAWWRNEGGDPVTWSKMIVDTYFTSAVIACAADVDLDGDIDVVGTGQNANHIAWWSNEGGDPVVWTRHMIAQNFGGAWPLYVSDIDGDEDGDIIAGGFSAGAVKWWENSVYGALFEADKYSGHVPFTVQFTDLSNADPQITSWSWDFNNDGIGDAQEQHPRYTYTQPGNYSVSLSASNGNGTFRHTEENSVRVFDGFSAIEFDGEKSSIGCAASGSLNVTEAFTVEAWIRPSGWGENPGLGYGRIIDKGHIALYLVKSHAVFSNHSLMLQLFHANSAMSFSCTPVNSIVLDEWQHLAVTYDGASSEVKIYLDGVAQAVSQTTVPSGVIADNSSRDLIIGNSAQGSFTFDGIIDEVRLWDVVRGASEINVWMQATLRGDEGGLVGYWRMEEGSGDTVSDNSGHGNGGLLYATQWVQGQRLAVTSVRGSEQGDGRRGSSRLYGNYPNPFNPSTVIRYELGEASAVSLRVYDIGGRLVRELASGQEEAGMHSVVWDGADESGARVSSGVYVVLLKGEECEAFRKVLLTR